MVKPAMPYLDVIADASQLAPDHPIACYQVSGEYAMVVAGANAGVYDLKTMAFESVQGMVRAGNVRRHFFTYTTKLPFFERRYYHPHLLHSTVLGLA